MVVAPFPPGPAPQPVSVRGIILNAMHHACFTLGSGIWIACLDHLRSCCTSGASNMVHRRPPCDIQRLDAETLAHIFKYVEFHARCGLTKCHAGHCGSQSPFSFSTVGRVSYAPQARGASTCMQTVAGSRGCTQPHLELMSALAARAAASRPGSSRCYAALVGGGPVRFPGHAPHLKHSND